MQEVRISLVIATLRRYEELELLLRSLQEQTLDKSMFELIIVDQNEDDLLDTLIPQYAATLHIKHIRSSVKGLSVNRNIGIRAAGGMYVAVPDDDCTYYADTLEQVERQLQLLQQPDMLIGKVYDRESGTYVFKKTPLDRTAIHENNFYSFVSSITLFFKKSELLFDETFGVGAKYYSNEDGEFILRHVRASKRIYYCPEIECNHPPYTLENTSDEKWYNYGIGFGAMCRKYPSAPVLFLFAKVLVFQLLMYLFSLLRFDGPNQRRRLKSLKGRWAGFFRYGEPGKP